MPALRRARGARATASSTVKISNPGVDDLAHHLDVSVNRIAVALVIVGGLIGSSLIGVLANDGPQLLGLHLLSVVGFVLSGAFGVWLLWGIVKSGRLVRGRGLSPASQAAGAVEEREHLVVREAAGDATVAADDVGRGPQRVEHGLLGRLDGRLEQLVEQLVGHELEHLAAGALDARHDARRSRARGRSRPSRGARPSRSARARARSDARRARAGPAPAARR